MRKVIWFVILLIPVLVVSCSGEEEDLVPIITIENKAPTLGPYGVVDKVEIPLIIYPAVSQLRCSSSTEDVKAVLSMEQTANKSGGRDGILTLIPQKGWNTSRSERMCTIDFTAVNSSKWNKMSVKIYMDIAGFPYIEQFPDKILIAPFRANKQKSILLDLVNSTETMVSVTAPDEFEVSVVKNESSLSLNLNPKETWTEDRWYGDMTPGLLMLTVKNPKGENAYSCPIYMPRLDVQAEVLFEYHGSLSECKITSDLPYNYELDVPEPLIPGDPANPCWNPNNPNPPTNDPRLWFNVRKGPEGISIEALPIKKPGMNEATLLISDSEGIYQRKVILRQCLGERLDYIDNLTDFEALWLIYESQTKFKTSLENQGWGASERRNWGGPVRLQRADKVIEFGNGGADCIPPEIGAFDKMTEFVYRPGHGDFNKREGIPGNTIPESMSKCKSLRTLVISYVLTEGDIPSWIGDLSNLSLLNLAASNIGGTVPEWFARLSYVSIKDCRFFGEVPKVVYESAAWKQDDNWTQQDGYLLYYVDESGNKVYPSQEGKSD